MRIDYFLIGIVVFGLCMFAGVQVINDVRTNYNIAEDLNGTYMRNSYNTLDQMKAFSEQQKNASLKTPLSDTDATTSMTTGMYASIKMIGTMFPLVQNIAVDVCNTVPGIGNTCGIWVTAAIVVITISIVFSIIVMILRAFVIQ